MTFSKVLAFKDFAKKLQSFFLISFNLNSPLGDVVSLARTCEMHKRAEYLLHFCGRQDFPCIDLGK